MEGWTLGIQGQHEARDWRFPGVASTGAQTHPTQMTRTLWILLAIAAVVVVGYFVTMRFFYKESKELDKKIDFSKIKKWKDDDD